VYTYIDRLIILVLLQNDIQRAIFTNILKGDAVDLESVMVVQDAFTLCYIIICVIVPSDIIIHKNTII